MFTVFWNQRKNCFRLKEGCKSKHSTQYLHCYNLWGFFHADSILMTVQRVVQVYIVTSMEKSLITHFIKYIPSILNYIENANILLMCIFKLIQIEIYRGKVGPYKKWNFHQRYTNKSGKPSISRKTGISLITKRLFV